MKRLAIAGMMAVAMTCHAQIDEQRLATAIGRAENSTAHPYGILAHYKHTTPRQACLNTIRHQERIWMQSGSKGDFITFLGQTYSPLHCANDPHNLNINWIRNVTWFYNHP